MLVSKNALSFIRFVAVEDESRREGTTQLAEIFYGPFPAFVAADFQLAAAGDSNLDVVALFQLKSLDDCGG
jgi:hypothetical protein